MNYYRRYMGDYAKKTASLSLAEHGAYSLLLDECYSTERPLPGDHESLFRLCRAMTKVEQEAVRRVADRFFPVGADGQRRNPRADEELAIAQPAITAAKTNGVKGGRPRKNPVGSSGEPTGGHPPTTNLQPPSATHQPSTAKPREKTAGRGARLPADWKPDAEQIEFCRQERPDLDPQATAALFRDHWIAQPGQRGVKTDWAATWRNWVRKEKKINGAGRLSVSEANRLAGEEAQRRFEEEQRAGR